METKMTVKSKSLSQEDFKRLEETQKQVEEIDLDQEEEKDTIQSFCFCFEGFCRHKCLIFNCFALLLFSIVISTLLSIVLSAVLLAQYGNIKKDICYPIQRVNQTRILSNGENISVIPTEKKLQIIAQNDIYVSIVMPCSSEVLDESGNIFKIEGPYKLNCSESRIFNYIKQYRTWRG
jgi:hypothetical protein